MSNSRACTRRSFLFASAASAALALAGCGRDPKSEQVIACSVETPSVAGVSQPDVPQPGILQPEAPSALDRQVDELLATLTLEQKVYQLFCVPPEAITGVGQVTAAGSATRAALEVTPVGGLIYFGHNIVDEQQFRDLIANTAAMPVPAPLFLCIDEEGGPLVARVANSGCFDVPKLPSMAEIGATGDPAQAYEAGSTIGSYLADIGLNVDFAPVADVLTNPDSSIGSRSFSSDPVVAASMVEQAVCGLQDCGVSAAAKHFPGHGDMAADSHTGAAVCEKTLDELRACEFVPFKAAIEAGVDFIMVGHISTPNAAGDGLPATLSRTAITDWLRGELGFEGVVVSDAMNMGAITQFYTADEAAVAFIQAGGDVVLVPEDFSRAYQGVLDAVASGAISPEAVDASVRRIVRAKLKRRQAVAHA